MVFTVNAQLTQSNNAPAAGDTYTMYQCDTISPGASGAGAMWNFASITTHSSIIKNYGASAVTNANYPSANVAVGSSTNDIAYLASTANSLGYYGGNIAVGLITGSLTYTAPAVNASYPMSLNTTSSSAIGGTVFISSLSMNGTFTGNSSVLVDGSGTITLPGTNVTFSNTLRVLTTQTMMVAVSIGNATVTQANYNYYAAGIKAPVFAISTSTAVVSSLAGNSTTTQTFVTRNKDAASAPTNTSTVGFAENNLNASLFTVFPNPSNTYVNFVTNHPDANQVSVYDITGKLVEKQNLNEGKLKVDVSSYNKGLYLYTVSSDDNRILKSGKITVSQ